MESYSIRELRSSICNKAIEKIKRNLRLLILSLLTGAVVILLFSVSISPLLGDAGVDSPLFMLFGKLMLQGERLYVDVFDHKGPIIFWINAVGMLLPDTWGMFILESITLGLTLAFVYKTALLFIRESLCVMSLMCYVLFYVYTMREGNSVNEYANLAITITLYYQMKYYTSSQILHPYRYAFLYGVCFSWISFMRISNNLFLIGMAAGILLRLLFHKAFKNAGINILYGMTGMLALALPICIWFMLQGAFKEMINATFLFNFRYSDYTATIVQTDNLNIMNGYWYIAACILPLLLPFPKKCRSMRLPLLLGSILAAIGLHLGVGYLNYSMMMLPSSLMVIIISCSWIQKRHLLAGVFVVLLILTYVRYGDCYRLKYYALNVTKPPYLLQNSLPIPKSEKNQVLGIDVPFFWYLKNDITPPYKYLGNQTWWSVLNPDISGEVEDLLRGENAPKWILTELNGDFQRKVINRYYKAVYSDINYALYKHK